MADLSKVVPHIYEDLEGLSSGDALNISDELLDEVTNNIKNAIKSWANPTPKDTNFTIRMSNVGKPARQLWFEKKDKNIKSHINAPTQLKFLYGHLLEEILLMLVKASGHKVTDQQKEVEINGIIGHIDCKIDGEVVDVKTASRFAFNKFNNNRLAEDDPFGYLGQLSGYEEAEGTSNGGFLVINKESGELCMHLPDQEDKISVSKKIDFLIPALDLDSAPELCYDPIPDGTKGNMKLPKACSWCKYKYECHKDANDGEGLRTFKYNKGLVYLTKVVSEPRVEECL